MYVYQQGRHDGLCGLYAILNAFRHLERQSPDSFSLTVDNQAYFDEMVEVLARCGGASLRMLVGNSDIGGLDVNYIAAVCHRYIRNNDLPIKIDFCSRWKKLTFIERYSWLQRRGIPFAFIAAHRNGGHWVAVGDSGPGHYDMIDEGEVYRKDFADRSFPLKGTEGIVLSLKVADVTGQDN